MALQREAIKRFHGRVLKNWELTGFFKVISLSKFYQTRQ